MEREPLISIITPNYNCASFIAETIESVLAQTYKNWEMLIQDDCSSDGSLEIALSYAEKDPRIKVESNTKNAGAAISRNNAIRRSQGEYLSFLDSDDLWVPTKLEKQIKFMQTNNCDFCYAGYEHINKNGDSMLIQAKAIKHLTYRRLLLHCWTGCLTVIYKQDLSNKIYGPVLKNCNDHGLFLKVMPHIKNAMGISECLGMYRIREGGKKKKKTGKLKSFFQLFHDIEGLNYITATFCLMTQILIKRFYKYKEITANESCTNNI